MDIIRGMSLFVEVARARSFTRAAEKLGIPTSTLSRRIGEIEQSLGLKLLHRTTRSVSLTDAGVLYLARAASLVEAAEEAHRHVRGLAERPSGLLRVSMEAEIGPTLIAPLVAEFRRVYPDVSFELDLSPRRVDLLAENYDVAVRLGPLPDSALTVRRLALLAVNLLPRPIMSRRMAARRIRTRCRSKTASTCFTSTTAASGS
jgi:DNA-binding transcriptional LysR family regulator